MKTCVVCGEQVWLPFLSMNTGRIAVGGPEVGVGDLEKVICSKCGVVTNSYVMEPDEVRLRYDEYQMGIKPEHTFMIDNTVTTRSKLLALHLARFIFPHDKTICEIGCGQGLVMAKLQSKFKDVKFIGIDGSTKAVEKAREKGLDVHQRLILGEEILPKADVVYAITVAEHIGDIKGFLKSIYNCLPRDGRLILCIPIQDRSEYDVFFDEHIWHFSVSQFGSLLRQSGFLPRFIDHDVGICTFVSTKSKDLPLFRYPNDILMAQENRDHMLISFGRISEWLSRLDRVAIFGAGELTSIFLAFTDLGEANVVSIIDDDSNKKGTKLYGIPINDARWLQDNEVDGILLSVNPTYHQQIEEKLKDYSDKLFSWLGG